MEGEECYLKKKNQRMRVAEELPFFKFRVNQIPNKTTNQLFKILEISSSVLLDYELIVKEEKLQGLIELKQFVFIKKKNQKEKFFR